MFHWPSCSLLLFLFNELLDNWDLAKHQRQQRENLSIRNRLNQANKAGAEMWKRVREKERNILIQSINQSCLFDGFHTDFTIILLFVWSNDNYDGWYNQNFHMLFIKKLCFSNVCNVMMYTHTHRSYNWIFFLLWFSWSCGCFSFA